MSRDPIGYSDCISLFEYVWDAPTNWSDPSGNQAWPPGAMCNPTLEQKIRDDIRREGRCVLTFNQAWGFFVDCCPQASTWRLWFPWEGNCRQVLGQGCVGAASCWIGRPLFNNIETDFQHCFNSLDKAKSLRDDWNKIGYCSGKNMSGGKSRAVIFGYKWGESPLDKGKVDRTECGGCGRIIWNDRVPCRTGAYDFGYYHSGLDCFIHASCSENSKPEKGKPEIYCDPPPLFGRDTRTVIYCVTCESDTLLKPVLPE